MERAGGARDFRAEQLLRAVYAAFDNRPWDAGEVIDFAKENLRTRIALRDALEAVVGDLDGVGASKSLGKFLQARAHEGAQFEGMRLERIDNKRPAIWKLCDFERAQSQTRHAWP